MAVPEWVTKELFENALREFLNNKNIQIHGFTSSECVPTGDNYTSDLFRTSVTYGTGQNGNKETMSIIVKCSPESKQQLCQLVKEINMFEKEAEMFRKTLPKIYSILGEAWTLSAKFIYYTKTPHTTIMFEDLAPLGFKMYNRQEGFDLDHCLMVVEKIARLHAASLVLYEKDSSTVANYGEGLFSSNETIVHWINTGLDSVIRACERWPGYEKYSTQLTALKGKASEKVLQASKRKLGGFNVLNHGDCWVNNFMFSYTKDGQLKDFKFVDYQLVIFSSPAIDLHYFWATSPKIEVRKHHMDTVLDHYYAQLLANLSRLQYSLERVPTRKQFRKDWNSRAFYGFIAAITVLPLVKASHRKDASFEDLMKEGEAEDGFRYHVYNNERFRKHMQYLLPFFDELGALDIY